MSLRKGSEIRAPKPILCRGGGAELPSENRRFSSFLRFFAIFEENREKVAKMGSKPEIRLGPLREN